ncbi:MAG: hypothetical protein HQK87_02995 [Nitrospinae bacterium]|nr:hypothetical protein [Nitrospinota bacterium]
MKLIIVIVLALPIMACATGHIDKRGVIESDSQMVEKCKFLGTVEGSSGWGNAAGNLGVENSKNEAYKKARDLGATNIVWQQQHRGFTSAIIGNAYRCD